MSLCRKLLAFLLLFGLTFFCSAQEKPKAPANPQAVAEHEHPAFKASPDFDRLRKLAGRWEGTSPLGPIVSTFRVTADGSAVMNMLAPDTKYEMLTVFHPDGANIMGTHYCSGHNQPRFVAEPSSDPKVMTFKFRDVTNLASADEGHIDGLVITFTDDNHHVEEWFSRDKGKVTSVKFDLTRKQ